MRRDIKEDYSRYFTRDYQFSQTVYSTNNDLMAMLTAFFGFSVAASNALVSVGNALVLLQLAGGMAYVRVANRKRFLRLSSGMWRLFMPCIYFCALLPGSMNAYAMAAVYLLVVGSYQFGSSVYSEWVTGTLEKVIDDNYYLRRDAVWLATYTAVSFGAGILLDNMKAKGMLSQGIVLCGIFFSLLLVISMYYLFRSPVETEQMNRKTAVKVTGVLREAFSNHRFCEVLVISGIFTFSSGFIIGFASIYRIQVLGVGLTRIAFWSTLGYIFRVLSVPLVAKVSERFGWKKVTGCTFFIVALIAVSWMGLNEKNMWFLFPVLSVLLVLPHSVFNVGLLKMKIDTTPAENRSIYFSVEALINGVASVIGGMASTALIGCLEGFGQGMLRYVFLVGAAGMTLCAALTLWSEKKTKRIRRSEDT